MYEFVKKQALALKDGVLKPSLTNPYTLVAGAIALAILGCLFAQK